MPAADDPAGRLLKIFINYRHEDTQPTAWMLYEKLEQRFGSGNVFFDRGTLRPGMRWFEEIKSQLATDGVVITLIGLHWGSALTANMRHGGVDYVVKEIDLALRGGERVTIIPVLADGAELPDPSELPLSLRSLVDRQAERLRPTHLPDDIDRLIARLDEVRDRPSPPPETPEPVSPATPRPRLRQYAGPGPDEDHYRLVAGQADNLVVFLGAGANADDRDVPWSADSGTLPDDRDLASYLASHVGLEDPSPHLAEIAQYAGATQGEMVLFDWVTQALRVDPVPGPVHKYLAQLPAKLGKRFQMIVTPKYDAALERAFKEAGEDFDVAVYMAPGTEQQGTFVHLPWGGSAQPIDRPNDYQDFPIIAGECRLLRTVIVRVNGTVVDPAAGFPWENNYVITEDHYIDYMSRSSATDVVPSQILAKLKKSNYLFLGYTITDWRLRVFLQRIRDKNSTRLGRAKYWAVEHEPDALAKDLWDEIGVRLYQCSLSDYLGGLYDFLDDHPVEART